MGDKGMGGILMNSSNVAMLNRLELIMGTIQCMLMHDVHQTRRDRSG
jgi:hypothetical protein